MPDHIPINAHGQLLNYLTEGEILEDELLWLTNQVRDCQDLPKIIDSLTKLATSLGTIESMEKILAVKLSNSKADEATRKATEETNLAMKETCEQYNKLIAAHKARILSIAKGE